MKWSSLALPLAALLVAGACSKKAVVGVVLPETGDAQAYGTSIKTGVKLAFDEAKAAGKREVDFEVVFRDSASDPARAAKEAEDLYALGALTIIGGATTPEARAMITVAENRRAVLLSPSASGPDLARNSKSFFRVFPSDELEGVKAADFLANVKQAKSVVVITEDNVYAKGLLPIFKAAFEKLGGKIVGEVKIGDADWDKKMGEILAKEKPAALYVCGYGEAIIGAMVEVRNAKFEGPICTTSAIGTVDLVWRGGKLVDGLYFPMTRVDLDSKQNPVKAFVDGYKTAFNLVPDVYAAHGYDAALLTIFAYAQGALPKTPAEMLQRFQSLGKTEGVTGTLLFDKDGNVIQPLHIHRINNGKVEDVEPGT